jgi:hypothetical protein
MTAAQKIAKEKFKKAIAYRQKTGVSLKEAFAHVYGKKVSVFKKTAKKKVVRKKVAKKIGKIDPNKAFKKQMQVNKIINTKYKDWEYPVPPVYTGNWSVIAWSDWIKKNGRKIGAIKRKTAKKKPSEQSILNKIHIVKNSVNKLDEAQHKHMMSGLTKIVGKIYNKYYIEYMHPNGYKFREYYNKYPINRYVGIDRNIYVPKLTEKGTSLIALKHSKTDKQVKK